jgi:hypothetical protein
VILFKEKEREFRTVNRVYCSNPKCSGFLGPRSNALRPKHFSCQKCQTRTCRGCKAEVIVAEASGSNTVVKHQCMDIDRQLLLLSRKSGWARCPECTRMVELTSGCFHIYCLCNAQFCYVCQKKWRTCTCPSSGRLSLAIAARMRVEIEDDVADDAPEAESGRS